MSYFVRKEDTMVEKNVNRDKYANDIYRVLPKLLTELQNVNNSKGSVTLGC